MCEKVVNGRFKGTVVVKATNCTVKQLIVKSKEKNLSIK